MDIKIKNTLSGQIETFKPIKKGVLKMYHCGPTVYTEAHIGNLRPYIYYDLFRKFFEYNNYKVKQVINITDVGHLTSDEDYGEDKVEKISKEKGLAAKEITKDITLKFFDDLEKLNINIKKIKFPRATKHIKEQIKLIKVLEQKGFTYMIDDGVYFDTSKFKNYGELGKIDLKNIIEGARVEKNIQKRNITDFALWKFSPENEKRQQEWNSPWGVGFPGWHIECSAMSQKLLGQPFDIHTGGIDHIPIHHNNEIAQSEAAFGEKLANYWLHINFLNINNSKISKSLGNTIYLKNLIEKDILPESFRYWILSSHYSSLINYTEEGILGAQTALKKLIQKIVNTEKRGSVLENEILKVTENLALDFNTPKVFAVIWDMLKNETYEEGDKIKTLLEIDKILGLNLESLAKKEMKKLSKIPKEILNLVAERELARNNKEWQKSDEIRDQILLKGYKIMDSETGTEVIPK